MAKQTIHDKAYKYLFSDPLVLKELLESLVAMDWVKHIDYTSAHNLLILSILIPFLCGSVP